MYLIYSILLSVAILLLAPILLLRREKYAEGFRQRLGKYPAFVHDGRPIIWLHCVSVGETNAARTLFDALKTAYPDHRLVVSTITKSGQQLARTVFAGKADAVFYFPFDWKFSVRKALDLYRPSLVLLMETEIWPRFIVEAAKADVRVAIVNGRSSARSYRRYLLVRPFFRRVLQCVGLALMQTDRDADHMVALGMDRERVVVTGNLKFDLELGRSENEIMEVLGKRFVLGSDDPNAAARRPLIVAASTHEPEERLILEAFCSVAAGSGRLKPRLLLAPRHPERFDAVERMLREFRHDPACEWARYSYVRRSNEPSPDDAGADVVILDSIGELRAVYPLADIVFVGGSLIPHGGQSVLEPAAAGKAIITGFHTRNFEQVVSAFLDNDAIIQLPDKNGPQIVDELFLVISDLIEDSEHREALGRNASAVMNANRGATAKTVSELVKVMPDRLDRP
ncbi:MAG TPA: 3-deoxy-D-manno-octulosonic acid transferase [Pyrinomonadaceae bacterium]|nr:3-deoxy-D-manno-octulosonic acid transferase [Pyrinomonadaceae bacterium]